MLTVIFSVPVLIGVFLVALFFFAASKSKAVKVVSAIVMVLTVSSILKLLVFTLSMILRILLPIIIIISIIYFIYLIKKKKWNSKASLQLAFSFCNRNNAEWWSIIKSKWISERYWESCVIKKELKWSKQRRVLIIYIYCCLFHPNTV